MKSLKKIVPSGIHRMSACTLVLLLGGASQAGETRLVRSGERAITFEITVPDARIEQADGGTVRVVISGYGMVSPPGALQLPGRTFHVAIPPTGNPLVSAAVLEEADLGELHLARVPAERLRVEDDGFTSSEFFIPPDPWPPGYSPPLVSQQEPSFMRRQRVLPVRISPLTIGAGRVRIAKRISVTVRIEGGSPGRMEPPGRTPVLSGAWRRLFDDLLVNPGDADRFGRLPEPRSVLRRTVDQVKRLRIRIPETGLYSVRADSLIAMGLSYPLSTGELALKRFYYDEGEAGLMRETDVPFLVVEGSSGDSGIFDAGDRLLFYTKGIRDDAAAGDRDAMFTDDNVVWLEENVAGAVMAAGDPLPTSPDVTVSTYRAVYRGRTDTYYEPYAKPGTFDFYFVKGPVRLNEQSILPFEAYSPGAADEVSIAVKVQGRDEYNYRQRMNFYIGSHFVGRDSISSDNIATITFSGIPSGWLVNGENSLIVTSDVSYGFYVDQFSVDYPARFVARGNMLEFAVGPGLGVMHIDVEGFTVNHGVMVEITDPSNPLVYELASDYFRQVGGKYTLSLNVTAINQRRFVVVGDGAGLHAANSGIAVDFPSSLREEAGPFHTLIVTNELFHPRNTGELADYADWRRGQGYRVLVADVQDVFDEFNGGLPHANAIRRFVQYGFERWGVEFVLLVGDGNEDHKGLNQYSPPDFVPPYTYCLQLYESITPEVIASDKYYAFLGEWTTDQYPDVMVGRLPVGEVKELRALALKLRNFEESGAGDRWRRDVLLFSDDAWSGTQDSYTYKPSELDFERSMERVASSIESALPGGFNVRRLYLSHWIDDVHSGGFTVSRDSTRRYFTPYLLKRINAGCLLYAFQGHARRSVFTSEHGFAAFRTYSDLDSLRPAVGHLFMGFGCHISEFARISEFSQSFDGPNGDCITEQLLFKPGAGAVGTYASAGFEFLLANARLCEGLFTAVFKSPPSDSVPPRKDYSGAHLLLGEVITVAEIGRIFDGDIEQVYRYILLGDPMTSIDPGPPLLRLEANWGGEWTAFAPDSLRARGGTNETVIRCTASDIVALAGIGCEVDGEDLTDSLVVTPITDLDKTYARAYRADLEYTFNLEDELLVFRVFKPDIDGPVGLVEIPLETRIRFFYNDNLEITPSVDCPPSGNFRLTVDFPAYLSQEPVLMLDGLLLDSASFTVPDPQDSLHWETVFHYDLAAGRRVLTLVVGDFSKDFVFTVAGNQIVIDAFNFPNPFRSGTNIVYSLNLPAERGSIEIYNVSGHRIWKMEIPRENLDAASFLSPHSIYWDGRDVAGDPVANGTYIYVIRVEKGRSDRSITGKCVKLD